MKYFVIGDEDTVLGFRLVGVSGVAVSGAGEAEQAFSKAISDSDVGIVVITEPVAQSIRSLVDQYTFTEDFPLIVEIPDRGGRMEGRPSLRELVNQAIGVSV